MQEIPSFENQSVEFKSQWGEKDGQTIKKTLVAFANTAGGDLYIGVDDDGQACGLDDIHAIEERIYTTIRDAIYPSISGFVSTRRLKVDGQDVLQVHVEQGRFPPYSLAQDDPRQIFVRIGCTSAPARIEDIAKMVERSNPVPFEKRVSFSQDLTFDYCNKFCRNRGLIFDPKVNINLGFWDISRGAWTNLAFLCSDQGASQFVLINFRDEGKTEVADAQKISGGLLFLLNQAIEFVSKSNYAGMEKPKDGSLERKDYYRVDPDAVREAIVNQLVHCDYSKGVPCSIHISPKLIEFWSAGGPHNVSAKDILEDMTTSCRNEALAAFLTRLKLMEGLGTGFRLIKQIYGRTPLERLVKITESSFKISLPRAEFGRLPDMDERQKIIVNFVLAKGSARRKEIEDLLHLSQPVCAVLLRQLVDMDVLEKEGAGPRTRYVIAPAMASILKVSQDSKTGSM